MAAKEKAVKLVLNQQQFELLDKTIGRAGVVDRESLVRLALRQFFASHGAAPPADKA